MKTKMNLQEFTTRINLLTVKQQLMINPQIYLNRDHILYYDAFNREDYEFCIDYLNENIELLNADKITNSQMSRSERREEMKQINREVSKMNKINAKLTKDEEAYIIENSKVLYDFTILSDTLYSGDDFKKSENASLLKNIKEDTIDLLEKLKINYEIKPDGRLWVSDEFAMITSAINEYCQLINGYTYYNWKNIGVIKEHFKSIIKTIDEETYNWENINAIKEEFKTITESINEEIRNKKMLLTFVDEYKKLI